MSARSAFALAWLGQRQHQRDAHDARSIEAPAGPIASVRENRMNADLQLGFFENFDFATFDVRRVVDGQRLERVIGLGF